MEPRITWSDLNLLVRVCFGELAARPIDLSPTAFIFFVFLVPLPSVKNESEEFGGSPNITNLGLMQKW